MLWSGWYEPLTWSDWHDLEVVSELQQSKVTLQNTWRLHGLSLQACFHCCHGNISPNQTEMCPHWSVCCYNTRRHFPLSARCQNCCGTPQRDNTHKLSSGKHRLFCHPTAHTDTHTHTLSQQREVVLKLWQTVQPAEAIHGELFLFLFLMQL